MYLQNGAGALSDEQGKENKPMLEWWYTLTAPPDVAPDAPFAAREQARRARLVSAVVMGFLISEVVLLLAGLHDSSYAGLVDGQSGWPLLVGAFLLTLVAAALNRFRQAITAGVILTLVAELPLVTLIFFPSGNALDIHDLPIYYLLVISEVVAVTILPPISVFAVAIVNSLLIISDFIFQPHTAAIAALLAQSDDTLTTLALPIGLQIIIALVAYLWTQNTLQALRRADRAEEIAALERREVESTRELEEGVRQLLDIHVQLSNGNFNVRAPAVRNQQLWHIGNSLNTLIARLSRLSQDSFTLQREREEAHRLAEAIHSARNGRYAIWPSPSGLPLDEVVAAVVPRQAPGALGATSAPNVSPPAPSPYAAPSPYSPQNSPQTPLAGSSGAGASNSYSAINAGQSRPLGPTSADRSPRGTLAGRFSPGPYPSLDPPDQFGAEQQTPTEQNTGQQEDAGYWPNPPSQRGWRDS